MDTPTNYLIATSVCLAFAYVIYLLFFRKETNFRQRRFFLIFAAIFSLLLPTGSYYILLPLTTKAEEQTEVFAPSPVLERPALQTAPTDFYPVNPVSVPDIEPVKKRSSINWLQALPYLYFAGLAVLLLRFVVQLVTINVWYIRSRKVKQPMFTLLFHERFSTPFSFFSWIFLTEKRLPEADLDKIIAHESVHVKQRHSFDAVFFELLCIFMWFNPIVWMMRRSINLTHEFLADEGAIQSGINSLHYQALMVNQVAEANIVSVTSHFNKSMLSQRIKMIANSRLYKKAKYKILVLAPVALILFLFIAGVNGLNQRKVLYRNLKKDPVISKVFSKDEIKDLVELRLMTDEMVVNVTGEPDTKIAYLKFNELLSSKRSVSEVKEKITVPHDSLVTLVKSHPALLEIYDVSDKSDFSFSINRHGKVMQFLQELSKQTEVYKNILEGIEVAGDISPAAISSLVNVREKYNMESEAERLYASIIYGILSNRIIYRNETLYDAKAVELNNRGGNIILSAPEEALDLFNQALEIEPDLPMALLNSANIYIKLHEFEKAKQRLRKLTEIRPEEPEYWRILGLIYDLESNAQSATKMYEKSFQLYEDKLDTNDSEKLYIVKLNLASLYVLTGNVEKGRELYDDLKEENPDRSVFIDALKNSTKKEMLSDLQGDYKKSPKFDTAPLRLRFSAYPKNPSDRNAECGCFNGIGSSEKDKPSLVTEFSNGVSVSVCGAEKERISDTEVVITEFNVFDCKTGKSLLQYGAVHTCNVKFEEGKLYITELEYLPAGENWKWESIPMMQEYLFVNGDNLSKSPRKFVYQEINIPQTRVDRFMQEVRALKGKGYNKDFETILGRLALLALNGNIEAENILSKFDSYFNSSPDGSVAELLNRWTSLINHWRNNQSTGSSETTGKSEVISSMYGGTFQYGNFRSGVASGNIKIYPLSDTLLLFHLAVSRGKPSYNSGELTGYIEMENITRGIIHILDDQIDCKLIVTFNHLELKIEVENDECGFGGGVTANGTYYRTNSEVPNSYFDDRAGREFTFQSLMDKLSGKSDALSSDAEIIIHDKDNYSKDFIAGLYRLPSEYKKIELRGEILILNDTIFEILPEYLGSGKNYKMEGADDNVKVELSFTQNTYSSIDYVVQVNQNGEPEKQFAGVAELQASFFLGGKAEIDNEKNEAFNTLQLVDYSNAVPISIKIGKDGLYQLRCRVENDDFKSPVLRSINIESPNQPPLSPNHVGDLRKMNVQTLFARLRFKPTVNFMSDPDEEKFILYGETYGTDLSGTRLDVRNWLSYNDLEFLMDNLESEEPCKNMMNVFSSQRPDYVGSTIGGFAALFLDLYRNNGTFRGLVLTPTTTPETVAELKEWWKNYKNENTRYFEIGDVQVKVYQLNNSGWRMGNDFLCRGKIISYKNNLPVDSLDFNDMEAVGDRYGLNFSSQPVKGTIIGTKFGDYDGRLILIDETGKIQNHRGGFFFITKDQRYIVSPWHSDLAGITIYDLKDRKVKMGEETEIRPANWYYLNGEYYTKDSSVNEIYRLDLASGKLLKTNLKFCNVQEGELVQFYNSEFCDCN